jgi:hypothetical protein
MIFPTKYIKSILQKAFVARTKTWLRPRLLVLYPARTCLLGLFGVWKGVFGKALIP